MPHVAEQLKSMKESESVSCSVVWDSLQPHDNSVGEESACNAGDPGSIPRWGRSPGEGNGLENPMDRGAWQATVHGVAMSQSDMIE